MRLIAGVCCFLLMCAVAMPHDQRHAPTMPDRFAIGRDTFFDVGPPFDYYELLLVTPAGNDSVVERVILTPPGNACTVPAKVELARATMHQSVGSLFGTTNPCTISEEELKRELRRGKKQLVFSGAKVAMQVQCGTESRVIRSDILDRDMFDPHPNTPRHTSWTMQLLARLDQALGPGVMQKPMFPMPGNPERPAAYFGSAILGGLDSGRYDVLFDLPPGKLSEIYRAANTPIPPPTVRLLNSVPFQPVTPVVPGYPAIARAAHIEGTITFKADIDSDGNTTNLVFGGGSPFLRHAVEQTVRGGKFPPAAFHQQIEATIEFALNCPNPSK